jgi:hypothetical protein
MKLEFSRQIFEKSSKIKFYPNMSTGSRVFPCERTDMTKLIVAFRNFGKAPKQFFTKNKITLVINSSMYISGSTFFPGWVNVDNFSTTFSFFNKSQTLDRRLLLRLNWMLPSSELLSVGWFRTDVSGRPVIRISKGHACWTDWQLKMGPVCSSETSVLNEPTLRKNPEAGRIHNPRHSAHSACCILTHPYEILCL